VIASLNAATRGIFDAKAFAKMKSTGILINTARGELVNQEDLVQALKSGQIRAAGLDVMTPEPLPPDHELCKLVNCVLVPHLGSAELETRTAMATMTARNIIAALTGRQMEAQVC
jgi:glyoxylate/hydroxypyruvate reductase